MSILLDGKYWGKKPDERIINSGFFTQETINLVNEAIDYNSTAPLLVTYEMYFSDGRGWYFTIFYVPFDVPENCEYLPQDFIFNYDNVEFNDYLSSNGKRILLENMNLLHEFAHLHGYNPFYKKNSLGKFYSSAYTQKNHHIQPIVLKTKWLDFRPNAISYHDVFGIPLPIDDNDYTLPHWEWHPLKYAFDTGEQIDFPEFVTKVLNIKTFKDGSTFNDITGVNPLDGLINYSTISTFWGGGVVPTWRKIFEENPNYSSLEITGASFKFSAFSVRWDPFSSRYSGYLFYRGFDVVDYTDEQLLVQKKYLLVYRDRSNEMPFDPTLCCLAQCFGITQ